MPARFDLVAPRADALMESLRATGYSLPDAVSDIIDNSITAGGRNIWMNFQWAGADSWVSILDDGRGMSESGLIDAMRIGSRSPREVREPSDLGRYGLGLKTASISQARSLTVATHVSKQRGMNTRQWDLDHLASTGDWQLLNVPASLLPACLCDTSPEQLARTFTLANDLSGGPTQARPGSRFDRAARGRSQVRNGWSRHGGRCRRWNRRRCWPGGHQGQVGHRGCQIQLELGFRTAEVVGLADSQLDPPRQPVLHHHAALPVLGKGLALLQGAGLL